MAGKGDGRRAGANDELYLKNNPFPSLLERRRAREAAEKNPVIDAARRAYPDALRAADAKQEEITRLASMDQGATSSAADT